MGPVLCLALAGCAGPVKLALAGSLLEDVAEAARRQHDALLVEQATPTCLLLIEGLLRDHPTNGRLLLGATQAYAAYAALVEIEDPERARPLYAAARRYGLRALSRKRGIAPLLGAPYVEFGKIVDLLRPQDVPVVFWAASSWGAWISANADSMAALAELPRVILLMEWVLAQDEEYERGSPHLFLGVYHGALPPALGGRPDLALEHFRRACEIAGPDALYPRVLMARYCALPRLDRELFESLLEGVLARPVDAVPELTLQNSIAHRQARALLDRADEVF